MAKQIISNKVYESLQVPTEQSRTTTGKILYANRFSGVAQVAMPSDLKSLIDSDLGLIGNNILVQLEQKMKGYANGPWYIDSRDHVGSIIHAVFLNIAMSLLFTQMITFH